MVGSIQKPSTTRIIFTDYLASLPAMMLSLSWGLYLLNEYINFIDLTIPVPIIEIDLPFFLFIASVFTIFDLPMLIWRVRSIQNVFERGLETAGKIQEATFSLTTGKIGYEYDFQDQNYSSVNVLRFSSRAKKYRKEQQVILIIDPENPNRAFIKDLYLAP